MIVIKDKKDCCGCTACANVCTHDAISMVPDALGFLYPQVDLSKCVECGLCEKVCQFNNNYDRSLNLEVPLAFAARHKDINEVMKSRSGAVFVALSDYILKQGGVIYGAGYKDHFRVVHKRATSKDERDEFRGSKYVQSDLTGVFKSVKDDLKKEIPVLFSGTPCQTAGLSAFVGRTLRKKLFLLDIVCCGVTGPKIWEDYLSYLEKRQGARINYVNFRDKEKFGWKAHKETFKFEGDEGKKVFDFHYYQYVFFRYSCGICPFSNMNRPSDITIADYWGWERTDSKINADDKGCSLVLCNSEKGVDLFEKVKNKMFIIPADLPNVSQNHLIKPTEIHPLRKLFEESYTKYGFEKAIKRVGLAGWRKRIASFREIPVKILVKFIKR